MFLFLSSLRTVYIRKYKSFPAVLGTHVKDWQLFPLFIVDDCINRWLCKFSSTVLSFMTRSIPPLHPFVIIYTCIWVCGHWMWSWDRRNMFVLFTLFVLCTNTSWLESSECWLHSRIFYILQVLWGQQWVSWPRSLTLTPDMLRFVPSKTHCTLYSVLLCLWWWKGFVGVVLFRPSIQLEAGTPIVIP